MPPQSRGNPLPTGFQSKSTPNLPAANPLGIQTGDESQSPVIPSAQPHSPSEATTPSEPASLEDSIEDLPLNGEYLTSDSECSDSLEEDSVVSEAGPGNTTHRRPYYYSTQSSRSLPPSSTSLFPPFYNRPPTPLPPSPSLTSLLRPSFSTQTSRPTTPETSDTESHSAAGHSAANALKNYRHDSHDPAQQTPVARASPKIPTYEYYGFALYLASSAVFIMYLLWAYLPSPLLHQLGISYYPNRWWALAVPAWLVVGVVWIYVALASYNSGHLTLGLGSVECVVDECGVVAVVDGEGRIVRGPPRRRRYHRGPGVGKKGGGKRGGTHHGHGLARVKEADGKARDTGLLGKDVEWRMLWSEGTDAVMDVPIGGVCEILYGAGRLVENQTRA